MLIVNYLIILGKNVYLPYFLMFFYQKRISVFFDWILSPWVDEKDWCKMQ